MSKKIFHIGAWNRNIGDWTMGYNTHRLLEKHAEQRGVHLSFNLIDSQRSEFHDALIQQINEEASLLLIGGGGMIFNRPGDESASGWAFNIFKMSFFSQFSYSWVILENKSSKLLKGFKL